METSELITAIEAYAKRSNLSPATITGRAVGNSRLYQRLKDGGDCTLQVARRVRDYIADQSKSAA